MSASAGEKSEKPTGKRLGEARKKGQVPRSVDLTGSASLMVAMAVLVVTGKKMLEGFQSLIRDGLLMSGTVGELTPSVLMEVLTHLIMRTVVLAAPLIGSLALAAIVVGGAQTRFNFATGALKPDFKRMNPLTGIKRIFALQGLVELTKAVIKMSVIAIISFLILRKEIPQLAAFTGMDANQALALTAHICQRLMWITLSAFLIISIADYFYQRYETTKGLKMTKDEVKQEGKQQEMSGEIKGAMKRRQREAAMSRMMSDVPSADVVVTNPTHFAVALVYDPEEGAPRVVAKGADLVAFQIREMAKESGVPVIEDPPLARAIYGVCEVGWQIPEEMFQAVALLLSYVYRLRGHAPGMDPAVSQPRSDWDSPALNEPSTLGLTAR